MQRHLPERLASDPELQVFLSKINDSFEAGDKDREFSERAFRISEKEYDLIHQRLRTQLLRQQEVANKLKTSLSAITGTNMEELSDDLLVLSNLLRLETTKRKDAESIFESLVKSVDDGILLEDINGRVLLANQAFCDLFRLNGCPKTITTKTRRRIGDIIESEFADPEQFKSILREKYESRKKDKPSILLLRDGRIIEMEYIPFFVGEEFRGTLWLYRDITDRERAQNALLERELTNNIILNGSPDAIVIIDSEGRINFWSKRAEAIFGWTYEEVTNRNLAEFIIPEEYRSAHAEGMHRFNATGVSRILDKIIEITAITRSGKTIFVELCIVRYVKENGVYFCSYIRDISDRKKMEQLLKKNESLLRKSQEISNAGSWEYDFETRQFLWTENLYRIRGLDPQLHELSVETMLDIVHPQDRAAVYQTIRQAMQESSPFNITYRVMLPDHEVRFQNDVGEVLTDKDGKPLKLIAVVHDITVQQKAEEELLRQKKFTDDVLNNLPADIAVFDKDHRYLFVNKRGIKNEELRKWIIGKDDFEYASYRGQNPQLAESRHRYFVEAVNSRESGDWIDDHITPEGKHRFILRRFYPYYRNDELQFVIGYGVDITERKEIELQLEASLEKTQAINRELEQFAFIASHDLQEPLRMITGFLTQLEKKYNHLLDDQGRKYIHYTTDGAKRMRQIILDLLEFSRASRLEKKIEQVDADLLVQDIILLLQRQINESRGIIVRENLPVITGFKTPLKQVFQNLISNALKYRNKHVPPEIVISSCETDTHWEFSVSDNGIGISEEYFVKIFELFQRLHTKEEYSGTGIGLSITKKIVENMGGRIWVSSTPGKGSKFSFSVPFLLND
jgi:PAS domain S-box-containing protein